MRKRIVITGLLVALVALTAAITMIGTGYVPAHGFSSHGQHERMFGMTLGAAIGIMMTILAAELWL